MGVLGFAVDWAVVTLNTWKFGTTRAVIQAAGGGGVLPYLTFCAFSVGWVFPLCTAGTCEMHLGLRFLTA